MKSIAVPKNKLYKQFSLTMLTLLLALIMASMSWGTEYYVDKATGNDSDSGLTEELAWATIQKASKTMIAGDTVNIKNGTYYEQILINKSGSSGSPITFQAYSGHNPVVNGTGRSVDKLINISAQSYIVWDGIDVTNSTGVGLWAEGSHNTVINCVFSNNGLTFRDSGLVFIAGDYNTVRYNEIYNSGWNGLNVMSCNYTTIEYNDIHDNDYHMAVNIYTINGTDGSMQTGNNVRYNKLYNNLGAGIYTRYQQNFEYVGNLIFGNTYSGIKFTYESGYASTYTCNGKIYNNTIANNGEDGIRSESGKSLTIKNNIIYGSPNYFINIYPAVASGHSFDNNLFYNTSFKNKWGGTVCSSFTTWQNASGQDAHSINKDPLFNNVLGNDYTLKSSSPAIDSGVNLGAAYDKCLEPSSSWPDSVKLLSQGNDWEMGAFIMTSGDSLLAPKNLRIVLMN